MKKIAILLCLLILVPALFIPGAAAGNAVQCICPSQYSIQSHTQDGSTHHFIMKVFFMNYGPSNAYAVTATISKWPTSTVTIIDGDVTMGDIPAGQGRWSKDVYEFTGVAGPGSLEWTIYYQNPAGVDADPITEVPQSPTACIQGCGTSAASTDLKPDLRAVEYRWAPPYYKFNYPSPGHFTGWMNVRIENWGNAGAYHVTATVIACPPNTTVPEPFVTFPGLIPAANTGEPNHWSCEPFSTDVDLCYKPKVDPCAGITWLIDYYYSDGLEELHGSVEVPQFPEGMGPCD